MVWIFCGTLVACGVIRVKKKEIFKNKVDKAGVLECTRRDDKCTLGHVYHRESAIYGKRNA